MCDQRARLGQQSCIVLARHGHFTGSIFQWTGGLIGGNQQGAIFTNTGVVNIAGDGTKQTEAAFTNRGLVVQSGTGAFNIGEGNSGGSFTNAAGATYDLQSDAPLGQTGYPFNNTGLFRKSGGTGTSTLTVSFNNQGGTVEVDSGMLQLAVPDNTFNNGSTSTGGTFNVANGALLDLGDGAIFTGTYSGGGGGTVRISQGTLYTNGTTAAIFNFPGAMLQWTGGTIGAGQRGHKFTNAGTLNISGDAEKLSVAQFANTGTIIQTGKGSFNIGVGNDGGGFTNAAGATYNLRSDGGVGQSGYLFTNAGFLEKTAGTGTSTMDVALTSTGTLSVYTGTLNFTQRVNDIDGTTLTGGTWNVFDGATLTFAPYTDGITINQAEVTLSGAKANFPTFQPLADNQGTFSLLALKSFTTVGGLTNSGTITLGAGSTLHINGDLTLLSSQASAAVSRRPAVCPKAASGNRVTAADASVGSVLKIAIAGAASQGANSFGVLQVSGLAKLAGQLQLTFDATAKLPGGSDALTILSAGSVMGSFENVDNGGRLKTSDGKGSFQVNVGTGSSANQISLSNFVRTGDTAPQVPGIAFVLPGSANGKTLAIAEGGRTLKLRVTRTGDDLSQAVTVAYKIKGSGKAGADYKTLSGLVTIPAGSARAKIKLVPLAGEAVDGDKRLKIRIVPSSSGAYTLGAVPAVKITILDADGG